MRTLFAAVALLGLSLTAQAQKQISLLATITDPSGTPLDIIDPAAVRVTENGTNATVVKVEPLVRTPKVQILIDNGSGVPADGKGLTSTLVELLRCGPGNWN